ncbi:mitochondrial fission ELM1 family protein [Luteimonas sp. RIT-PG2_3]
MVTLLEQTVQTAGIGNEILAISDGRAGNARQAQALAEAVAHQTGGVARPLQLQPRAPWRWLSPRRLPGSASAFGPDFAAALASPPALAIGCGRQAALATRLLRERGARAIQILDPRLPSRHWDLLVLPEHDGRAGDDILRVRGSLHPVDERWLADARASFPHLGQWPSPRTTLLVGGDTHHARFDVARLDALLDTLDHWRARDGGSVLATTSRRTPPAIRERLRARLRDLPGMLWSGADGDGENPYPGLLAWADRIVCTPDSVNMLSEACATSVPVFVSDPATLGGRPRRFVDGLLADAQLQVATADAVATARTPLGETARLAALVCERLGLTSGRSA